MTTSSINAALAAPPPAIGFFERYLTVWVALCIVAGIGLGQLFPDAFRAIAAMEVAKVNVPVGVLIWVMIVPMLLKIDFGALGQVKSHWRGISDINSASVGIEIVNPGHEWGYVPFPDPQVASVVRLVHMIKDRYAITRGNVVGHSDIAPTRKQDPGELFPWDELARRRLALPRPTKKLTDPLWTDAGFLLALERFGYDVTDGFAATVAFQRRFRPELIDGTICGECRAILLALLLPQPEGN